MNQLTKIILINSFLGYEGRYNELATNLGGVHLEGDNSAGKTSLLRLLPVFMGAEYSDILRANKTLGNVSFADYYFPCDDSILIFEYVKDQKERHVVMYPDKNGHVLHYFVDAAYKPEYYIDYQLEAGKETFESKSIQQVRLLWDRDGVKTYSPRTRKEYKAIMFNDYRYDSKVKSTGFKEACTRFGLVPVSDARRIIKFLDLASAMSLDKNMNFDQLEDIITEMINPSLKQIILEHGGSNNLRQWERDIRGIRAWDVDLADEHLARGQSLNDCTQQFKANLLALQKCQRVLESELTASNVYLKTIEGAYQLKKKEYSESAKLAQSRIIELNETLPGLKSELSKLDDRYCNYIDNESEYLQLIESESRNQAELVALKKEFGDTSKELQFNSEQLDKELEHIKQESKLRISQLETRHSNQKSLLNEKYTQLEKTKDALHSALQIAMHDTEREFDQKDFELQLERTKLEAQPMVSPELTQDLKAKTVQLSQQSEQLAKALAEVNTLQQSHAHKHTEKQNLLHKLKNKQSLLEGLNAELEQLTNKLEPKQNSLHAFLVREYPDWERSVGCVIKPELLDKTNLEPSIDLVHADSIFGLLLDHKKLEPFSAKESIFNAIEQQEAQILKEQKSAQTLQVTINTVQADIKSLDILISEAKGASNRYQRNIDTLNQEIVTSQNQIDQIIAEHEKCKSADIQSLEKRSEQLGKRRKLKLDALKADFKAQIDTKQIDMVAVNLELDALDERFNQSKTEIKVGHEQRTDRIKARHTALLESDEHKAFTELKASIKAVEKALIDACSAKVVINEFESFKQGAYLKKPVLEAKIQEFLTEHRQLKELKLEAQAKFNVYKETYNRQLEDTQAIIKRCDSQINRANNLLTIAHPELLEQAREEHVEFEDCSDTFDVIVSSINTLNKSIKKSEKRLSENKDKLKKLVDKVPDSAIYEAFATSHGHHYHLAEVKTIQGMLDRLKASALNTARSAAASIIKINQSLDVCHREIELFSKKWNKDVQTHHHFDSFECQMLLSSKVSELDFYQHASGVKKEYSLWKESGDELPSDSLIRTLLKANLDLNNSDSIIPFKDLFSLKLEVIDSAGTKKTATNAANLNFMSSNGVNYLIILTYLTAIIAHLKPDGVALHLPVDELGTLSPGNIKKLKALTDARGIYLASAEPNQKIGDSIFKHHYQLDVHSRTLFSYAKSPSKLDLLIHNSQNQTTKPTELTSEA